MDQSLQLNTELLRNSFLLPQDVTLVVVNELDEKTQEQIGAETDDVAVTRSSVRAPSKIVDPEFARLLDYFRQPQTIVTAIAKFCAGNRQEAETVLEQALPIFIDLVNRSILVTEDQLEQQNIDVSFQSGDVFSGYEIIRCLQLFSDSEVYQARTQAGQFCALKITRKTCSISVKQRFLHEATMLRKATGEGCVSLLAQGDEDKRIWLALNWLSGVNVSKFANELREQHDWLGLKQLIVHIAQNYATLHENNIGHGDIHPNNVLVTTHGTTTLIDFGYASDFASEDRYERGGVAFYYEPEYAFSQLNNNQRPPRISALGEQFSVAAMIYQLVTGNYYNDFELEHTAMYQAIANAQPKELILADDSNWPDLQSCLFKAMSVNPEHRFSDMKTFTKALQNCSLPDSIAIQQHKSNHDNLMYFVEQTISIAELEKPLFCEGYEHGPTCSLNGGSAGIAYALYRLACLNESPGLLTNAELWAQHAQQNQHNDDAYYDLEHREEYAAVGAISVHHGPAGISFIRTLIALSAADLYGADIALSQFINDINQPCSQKDTTLGKLSGVLAACEIIQSMDELPEKVDGHIIDFVTPLLDSVWKEIDALEDIKYCQKWRNLGFAHGWAGLLYTTLLWHKVTATPLPSSFEDRLSQFVETLHPTERGLSFFWHTEDDQSNPPMNGWCNGSAGVVHLFALLYEMDQQEKWLNYAEQLAWHVWESGTGPIDLCCGSAGRIFALLRMYHISQQSDWLDRAHKLTEQAIELAPSIQNNEHEPYSLFKGQLGLSLAVHALHHSEYSFMPMMGLAV
jgi:serine/threonine-protein kinase